MLYCIVAGSGAGAGAAVCSMVKYIGPMNGHSLVQPIWDKSLGENIALGVRLLVRLEEQSED